MYENTHTKFIRMDAHASAVKQLVSLILFLNVRLKEIEELDGTHGTNTNAHFPFFSMQR